MAETRSNHGLATRHGFTLIELLIVVAIISLLLSILVPAIVTAVALARQAKCLGNLKGISGALATYAAAGVLNDNADGWYYPYCGLDEGDPKPCPENWLTGKKAKFCEQDLFFCPSDDKNTYKEIAAKWSPHAAKVFWPEGPYGSKGKYVRYMHKYDSRDGEFSIDGMQSSYIWEQGIIDKPTKHKNVDQETVILSEGCHVVNCWTWSSLTDPDDPRSDQLHLWKNVNILRAGGSAETVLLTEFAK